MKKGITYIEQMIKFGNRIQDSLNSSQVDMFGDSVEISPWYLNLLKLKNNYQCSYLK